MKEALKESSLSSLDFTGVYLVTATLHNRQTDRHIK